MFFDTVKEGQPDAVFGLLSAFAADSRPKKINLLAGVYKDEKLRSDLFPSVQRAKELVFKQDSMADYLPIDGFPELPELIGPLVFGRESWKESQGRIYAAHTVGSTGALRVAAEFLRKEIGKKIYIPNFSWPNHHSIFEAAGLDVENYPYYSREKMGFDFEAMAAFLEQIPERSLILLHACCHNPTGCDPKSQEWKELSLIIKERKLFPLFDFAYQGLGEGNERDAEAVRTFLQDGHEMVVAYSCAKNFSMYCQRVGALFVVGNDGVVKQRVGSQVKRFIRALYSNPPSHGARIVTQVLKDPDLRKAWEKDLEGVRHRLNLIRESFVQRLLLKADKVDFSYLKVHKGMFSFIDLEPSHVKKLIQKYGVYLLDNGRISICGLTAKNIDYVVDSIIAVCES